MISEEAGSIWNVNGISNATAIVGLSPGVAPSNNPPIVPNTRISRLIGVNTSAKYWTNSTGPSSACLM